ncbi:hypothetical protein MMC16_001320 [Acarospora aff. strigata]|nr:hypothetical protein [Acarospora aff. strigata]
MGLCSAIVIISTRSGVFDDSLQATQNEYEANLPRRDHEVIFIEELPAGDLEIGSDVDILRPDGYEDADSEQATNDGHPGPGSQDNIENHKDIIEGLKTLHCDSDEEVLTTDEARRREKRQRGGLFKRSHSQSVSNDTDGEPLDAHGSRRSARRLRRRVRGPSLRFLPNDARTPEAEFGELEVDITVDMPLNEFDMEDYSTESVSVATTNDAMDVEWTTP